MSFDYDAWLESPYTSESSSHTHSCVECDGKGLLWLEDEQKFSDTEPCPDCEEGEVYCDDNPRDCFDDSDRYDD